jgi:ribonuclease P protein component
VGEAVRRNRIKRRLRHAVRALQLEPDMDYVIIASAEVAETPFPQLVQWLQGALERSAR